MPIYALGDQVPDIDPTASSHPDAVVIGSVTIGAEASIWPGAVLRGDDGAIYIGARTSIQDGSVLHTTMHQPHHGRSRVRHRPHRPPRGLHHRGRSLVGNGSVVLHNAIVPTGALVGSNAVVPNNMEVPSGAMALGVPAKIRENTVEAEMIVPPMRTYVERAESYRTQLRRIDLDSRHGSSVGW